MNGIEKITARIRADAEAECAAIRAESEERCAAIRAENERAAQEAAHRLGLDSATHVDGFRIVVAADDGATEVATVVRKLTEAGITVAAARSSQPTLDEVFMRFVGESK